MILRRLLPRCSRALQWQTAISSPRYGSCRSRTFSSQAEAAIEDSANEHKQPVGFPYRLNAAVILERYQVITPDETEFEKKYSEWAEQIHIEKSKYSVAELMEMAEALAEQREKDSMKPKAKAKKGKKADAKQEEAQSADNAMDETVAAAREEAKNALKEQFVPASRVTEADRTNNRQSTARALQRTLYLLVRELPKKGSGGKAQWRFPQLERNADEVLRQTAERLARTGLNRGDEMRVYHIGNCPAVHMTTVHPPDADGFKGEKTFFFRAQWLDGPLTMPKKYSDYVWVTREEIAEYVAPAYYERVRLALRR